MLKFLTLFFYWFVITSAWGLTVPELFRVFGTCDNLYAAPLFIATGNGSAATSLDGKTWTVNNNFNWLSLGGHSICYNGNIFVFSDYSVGHCQVFISANGLTDTSYSDHSDIAWFQTIIWDGTQFLATGAASSYGRSLWMSSDGITWTESTTYPNYNPSYGIFYNGNAYVCVGGNSATGGKISYTTDLTTWTTNTTIFTTCAYDVCCGNGRWVAVGSGTNTIAYSDDGTTWVGLGTSIFSSQGTSICFDKNKNRFVAVGWGTNTIAYSDDGITWVGLGTSIFNSRGTSIFNNGTRFVATGYYLSNTYGLNTLAYSDDGITWVGLGTSFIGNTTSQSVGGRPCPNAYPSVK